jgi:hypothetical protein
MRLILDGAAFRVADYDENAMVGLEIAIPPGIRCVICPSRPVNRIVNQFSTVHLASLAYCGKTKR